jgi:AcrR family transcriptional regulator
MRPRDLDKEKAIRQKAIEIIVKEGFDGLSMHKLAKAAKVSPATIYIYFKDREDLIVQIGIEEELKMFEATLKGFNAEMSFEEGMRVQWNNRAQYFLENPLQLQFMEQLKYSPYHSQIVLPVKSSFSNTMSKFVHKAIDNQELVLLPIEVFWAISFAPLYQLVKFHINKKGILGSSYMLDSQSIDLALSIVLKGLKPTIL